MKGLKVQVPPPASTHALIYLVSVKVSESRNIVLSIDGQNFLLNRNQE